MESVDQLWRRTNEAGVRFVRTEIDLASALLTRIARTADAKQRAILLKEARAKVDFASRLAARIEFPGAEGKELSSRIRALRARLEE